MLYTIAFLFLSAFTIWLLRYTYRIEITLEETEEALDRSRWFLKIEKEYTNRLEKELLNYQPK